MSEPDPQIEAWLADDEEHQRLRGVHALRDGPGDAADRCARLVEVLADPGRYVPHAARAALQTLGSEARTALLSGVTDSRDAVRVGCLWALAVPQAEAAEGIAAQIAGALSDPERDVRQAAAGALGRIGCSSAAELLGRVLADPDSRVRLEAVRSLGLLGAGSDVVVLLVRALDDGRPEVRLAAVEALAAAAPHADLIARVEQALDEEPAPHLHAPLLGLLERWRA